MYDDYAQAEAEWQDQQAADDAAAYEASLSAEGEAQAEQAALEASLSEPTSESDQIDAKDTPNSRSTKDGE